MPIAGKSLLEWAVRSARESGIFDRISVSTEDDEVAAVAEKLDVEIPFKRPAVLARDPAGVVEVALHALDEWQKRGEAYDTLVILLPTSPFRTAVDIQQALQRYLDTKVNFLMSVTEQEHSPLSSLILKNGLLTPLHPEWLNKTGAYGGADTPVLVRANGAVTIVDVDRFRVEKSYYAYPLAAYKMPWERSIDIDTLQDYAFAQFIAREILRLER